MESIGSGVARARNLTSQAVHALEGVYYGPNAMPMAHRGPRMPLTVRLPFDLYKEVAIRARARNWSLSDYVTYCVARELGTVMRRVDQTPPRSGPTLVPPLEWVEEPWEEAVDER